MLVTDLSLSINTQNKIDKAHSIRFGNNIWMGAGLSVVQRSLDNGATWSISYIGTYITSLEFVNDRFFVVDNGRPRYSVDGILWTEFDMYIMPELSAQATTTGSANTYSATIDTFATSYAEVYLSVYLEINTTNTNDSTLDINGFGVLPIIVFGEEGIEQVSPGLLEAGQVYGFYPYANPETSQIEGLYISQFPLDPLETTPLNLASNSMLSKILGYENGKYIALGTYFPADASMGITYSEDLITWTHASTGLLHNYLNLTKLKKLNGVYYTFRDYVVFSSIDGISWETVPLAGVFSDPEYYIGIIDLEYNGNVYLMMGADGTVLTSLDMLDWSLASTIVSDTLGSNTNLISVDETFYIASDGQGFYKSIDDGVTWSWLDAVFASYSSGAVSICKNPTTNDIMVISSIGDIRISTDGQIFTTLVGAGFTPFTNQIANNGNIIVYCASVSSGFYLPYASTQSFGYTFRRSTDAGITWSGGYHIEIADSDDRFGTGAMTYNGTAFIAVGLNGTLIYSSDNGITWTEPSSLTSNNLTVAKTLFGKTIIGGDQGVIISGTGTSLALATVDHTFASTGFKCVDITAKNSSTFLMLYNKSGSQFLGTDILTSADANDWELLSNESGLYGSIATDGTTYLMMSSPYEYYLSPAVIVSSTDGITWDLVYDGGSTNVLSEDVFDIIYQNGRFICIGHDTLAYSEDDGVTWVNKVLGYSNNVGTFYDCHIVLPSNKILAISGYNYDAVFTTDDGDTWETFYNPGGPRVIKYVHDRYWGFMNYKLSYSADGFNWTPSNVVFAGSIFDISYCFGKFVLVGDNGLIVSSTDGENWEWISSVFGYPFIGYQPSLTGVVSSGTTTVVVGFDTIYTTEDLITWTEQTSPTQSAIFCLSYINSKFVAYTNGFFDTVARCKLLVSEDEGVTWSDDMISGQDVDGPSYIYINAETLWHDEIRDVTFLVGYIGGYTPAAGGYIGYSYDLSTWYISNVIPVPADSIIDIKSTESMIVTITQNGVIHTSNNLEVFTNVQFMNTGELRRRTDWYQPGGLAILDDKIVLTKGGEAGAPVIE